MQARGTPRPPELIQYASDLTMLGESHGRKLPLTGGKGVFEYDAMNATGPLRAPRTPMAALSDRIACLTALVPPRRAERQDELFAVRVNVSGTSASEDDRVKLANMCIQSNNYLMAAKLIFPQSDVSTPLLLNLRSVDLYYELSPVGIRDVNWGRVPDYSADDAQMLKNPEFTVDKPDDAFTIQNHLRRYPLERRLDCDERQDVP